MSEETGWWVKGTLFENCNCQIICPGHIHFKQLCTYERCQGFWGIHIKEGQYLEHKLDDLNVVIIYDAPQNMVAGDWKQAIYIDERATTIQRQALELLLTGKLGGPWEVLNRFVGTLHETKYVPIHFEEDDTKKKMSIKGIFQGMIENLRGSDRSKPVALENAFNQIHGSVHLIASGETEYTDHGMVIKTKGSHGLHSSFRWSGQVSQ